MAKIINVDFSARATSLYWLKKERRAEKQRSNLSVNQKVEIMLHNANEPDAVKRVINLKCV